MVRNSLPAHQIRETEIMAARRPNRLKNKSVLESVADRWPLDGRPRLLHVMPWDLTVGGAQRMLDMWCSLEAHRWDTHILSMGARGSFEFAGATVHSDLENSQLQSLAESLRPDLLVRHEPADNNIINVECPEVWILHCTNSLRLPPPNHRKPAVVFSNFDSDEIQLGWRRLPLSVLRPQIDPHQFRPGKRRHAGLVCGIVGRLHEDKVPISFIDALKAWEPGPWRIRFVGHGLNTGYQRRIKRKLAKVSWVEFAGDVPPDRMPATLRQLDAVLIPTDVAHGETGSYAALEAMSIGLPVIARDLAGLRYNCGDAPLYAKSDADLLARLRVLDDAGIRSAAAARTSRLVVDQDTHKHAAAHSAAFAAALRCEVSILIPVFDTPAAYLADCWESICAQDLRAWELVLVDDGSRARPTIAEIDRIARDPRVVLVRLDKNYGISHALNVGLSKCRANLVARMDADDKMLPTRLVRQRNYFRDHPEVVVLGAQLQAIDWETERLLSPTDHPEHVTNEYIKHQRNTSEIWFLNHPTVMFRRREVVELGGYPSYQVAQDLGLWLKVVKAGMAIHNLPTVEVHYRLHPNQVSTAQGVRREEYAQIVADCWKAHAAVQGEPA